MNLHTLRSQYRDAIIQLATKYKLENVRVFGSVVRGEERNDSDIDMLVHVRPGCSLLDICGFEIDVTAILGGHKVDVVDDAAIKARIAPFILAEAVPL